ncbi:hypothetical protein E2C01_025339 [Portunus trituberculatus]|uniref:Uncharacterized protein n=1 Tax=Portunus trituberculatus TaxID=210409 RepID=A0A5B7EFQ7_PORTR|nr:hypothetical protein [Portunus trituberculatus]
MQTGGNTEAGSWCRPGKLGSSRMSRSHTAPPHIPGYRNTPRCPSSSLLPGGRSNTSCFNKTRRSWRKCTQEIWITGIPALRHFPYLGRPNRNLPVSRKTQGGVAQRKRVQQPLLYIILTGILMILSVMMVITCLLVHHKKQLRRLNKEG